MEILAEPITELIAELTAAAVVAIKVLAVVLMEAVTRQEDQVG